MAHIQHFSVNLIIGLTEFMSRGSSATVFVDYYLLRSFSYAV